MSVEQALDPGLRQAIAAAQSRPRPLVDRAVGRKWQMQLQAALGSPTRDRTAYVNGSTYQYEVALGHEGQGYWLYSLRIWISGAGPYAHQAFVRESRQSRWGGPCQLSRGGFEPEHQEVLAKLRAWYAAQGLTELDDSTRAQPVPLPDGGETYVHRLLFG